MRLGGAPSTGLVVCPEGRDAAWPPGLLALLGGGTAAAALREGPRRVLAPLLLALAAEAGWTMSLAQGSGAGAPLLRIGPG
ncbi:hypothetical protein [Dankookia sp. P2]|uniref:hypothetical protein n=1 Tax=Dankookia sp. P2 TaxID=3423955 RepID=UPI003D66C922